MPTLVGSVRLLIPACCIAGFVSAISFRQSASHMHSMNSMPLKVLALGPIASAAQGRGHRSGPGSRADASCSSVRGAAALKTAARPAPRRPSSTALTTAGTVAKSLSTHEQLAAL
jgi:hypothetical protein